jgi:hypothetical protein
MKIRCGGKGIVRQPEKHKWFLKTNASGSLNLIELPAKRFPFIDFNSTNFEQRIFRRPGSVIGGKFFGSGQTLQEMVFICQFRRSLADNWG